MKLVEINSHSFGSTGSIMLDTADAFRQAGNEAITFSPVLFSLNGVTKVDRIPNHSYYGSFFESGVHYFMGRFTGRNGAFSIFATYRLLRTIDRYSPDIIHLHNLHNFTINLKLLFRYIAKKNIPIVWTFHDCWPFTGHCVHFEQFPCNKWKIDECKNCEHYDSYPKTSICNSEKQFRIKKELFSSLTNLTIVTPSNWMANLVRMSFLSEKSILVINNGIDLDTFKPTESDFREKYNLVDKKIVLGVSSNWSYWKGLDVFLRLSDCLPEDYTVVLVGLSKENKKDISSKIVAIEKTANKKELAEIYSSADVFLNPTRKDTFPTVNIEALACGLPVVTFKTGGSPEIIDNSCGLVLENESIDLIIKRVKDICINKPFSKEACIDRAKQFDKTKQYQTYVDLYESIVKKQKGE